MGGGEDGAAPRIDFASGNGAVAGPFEALAPSADGTTKKVKGTHDPSLTP
jgi:hypothetical protein